MMCWVPPLLLLLLHGGQHGVDCLPQGQASPAGGKGGQKKCGLRASCSSLFISLDLFIYFEMTEYCLLWGVLVKNRSVLLHLYYEETRNTRSNIASPPREFPKSKLKGVPKGTRLYLTVHPELSYSTQWFCLVPLTEGRFFWLDIQQKTKLFWNTCYLLMTIGSCPRWPI